MIVFSFGKYRDIHVAIVELRLSSRVTDIGESKRRTENIHAPL